MHFSRTHVPLLAAAVLAVFCLAAPDAHAQGYSFTNFDDPAATQGTFAYSINHSQQVAGTYVDSTGAHGFLATLTAAPEPSACTVFALSSLSLAALILLARRRPAA